jgi:HSP20 family protein
MADEEKTSGETKEVAAKPRALGFPDLRDEMDRLWDAVMAPGFALRPFRSRFFREQLREPVVPAIDVYEKDGQLHVRAELPGVKQEDVDISVTADSLTISGEKSSESEVKEENYYRSERSYGKFSRTIALPAGADVEQANARFKDGVLEIDVPVKAAPTQKKIAITGT